MKPNMTRTPEELAALGFRSQAEADEHFDWMQRYNACAIELRTELVPSIRDSAMVDMAAVAAIHHRHGLGTGLDADTQTQPHTKG